MRQRLCHAIASYHHHSARIADPQYLVHPKPRETPHSKQHSGSDRTDVAYQHAVVRVHVSNAPVVEQIHPELRRIGAFRKCVRWQCDDRHLHVQVHVQRLNEVIDLIHRASLHQTSRVRNPPRLLASHRVPWVGYRAEDGFPSAFRRRHGLFTTTSDAGVAILNTSS